MQLIANTTHLKAPEGQSEAAELWEESDETAVAVSPRPLIFICY